MNNPNILNKIADKITNQTKYRVKINIDFSTKQVYDIEFFNHQQHQEMLQYLISFDNDMKPQISYDNLDFAVTDFKNNNETEMRYILNNKETELRHIPIPNTSIKTLMVGNTLVSIKKF